MRVRGALNGRALAPLSDASLDAGVPSARLDASSVMRSVIRSIGVVALSLGSVISVATADDQVTISLSSGTASELRGQLAAAARPPDVLSVLGIRDVAEMTAAVPVPMRDGVELAATVIRPRDRQQGRFPVVLIRTPY